MYRVVASRAFRAGAPQKAFGCWFNLSRSAHTLPFATLEADEISGSKPGEGKWTGSSNWSTLLDPLNGEQFIRIAEVGEKEIQPFVESLSKCPKHGLHNPFKSPERYLLYGDISTKAAHMLSLPKVSNFFTRLIQRVSPKSYQQALGEVQVTQKFLENFCGDQVRFLARSFAVPGNHLGQQSHGYRWPYGPFTTEAMLEHMNKLLKVPGSKLLFGGEELKNHSIPSIYGALKPTAIFVPLEEILKDGNYELVTREIFGPFQIVTEYKQDQLPLVLNALERMHAHLTAAVFHPQNNETIFCMMCQIFCSFSSFLEVIGNTVNGTTYAGLRARTTGAPQNHWFGPSGDPRGAGIGTPEAIKLVWSSHREIIYDYGPIPGNWEIPPST
ncbi:hypothetical protein CUMW_041220 [Citrus unshiu]|nr:hypothetical protein CUMW_041220 [Citrus unshiu]